MDPLPTVAKAYSLLLQEERQRSLQGSRSVPIDQVVLATHHPSSRMIPSPIPVRDIIVISVIWMVILILGALNNMVTFLIGPLVMAMVPRTSPTPTLHLLPMLLPTPLSLLPRVHWLLVLLQLLSNNFSNFFLFFPIKNN
ncbi:hypothetical protein CFOL_v3_09207 [Cephalotus follicularis]|uniref:Uncharacterized protein n=1 Tax=Cephalotus follicularis TaxID=3775 RepID=A0A1Q3BD29_CEPFO|nr:hypothetical protein CFOL_v3_09207 [Cephalotus follicularis]